MGHRRRFIRPYQIERYGTSAVVTGRQLVEHRRALPGYDRKAVLIDLLSDTGIEIQWTESEVRRATRCPCSSCSREARP